ncbi:AI-2E family transporter [Pedobacter sp.]|uniref:AI-2E family transporter n=1 Tax=Pedobacter sp. TaxID=1411316 RepID=UPI003D7FA72D
MSEKTTTEETTYIQKVWQTVIIVALLVVFILIARVAFNVLLMVLAGALISLYFHGLGDVIQRNTKLNRWFSMFVSIAGTFLLIGSLFWFMGTKIQNQISILNDTLPNTINNVKLKLAETPTGLKVLNHLSGKNSEKLLNTAQHFFSTSFGVLGNLYIIILLGIFFTANPILYKNGMLKLVPKTKKMLFQAVIERIIHDLKGWLKATVISMVLITLLITIGLTIMGIPVALVLGLITGMLKLIPNFGSLVAMVPGILLGLTIGTNTAIITALIYVVSQMIVSSIVTPIIQEKIINLPPALTIVSQVIMGTLSGALGIILAVPLLVIVIILVDELYVKKITT